MDRRIVSVMDRRDRSEPKWPNAVDEIEAGWDSLPVNERDPDETPILSLARRLERSHHLTGRVAHWLLIKGGIVIVLLSGLIVLGLAGALLGLR
jgi:hypothetical protein